MMTKYRRATRILLVVLIGIITAFALLVVRKKWEGIKSYGSRVLAWIRPVTITVASPGEGAREVPPNNALYVFFSKALDPSSLSDKSVILQADSTAVSYKISYIPSEYCVVIKPDSALGAGISCRLMFKGGDGKNIIKDTSGKAMPKDITWSFRTAMQKEIPDPAFTPGGPVLLLTSSTNGFSKYPIEILRAEGWNAFQSMDIASVTTDELNKYDIVIVGDIPLTAQKVSLLTAWVNAGGTLIAFHPDHQLANLLGLVPAGGTISEKFIKVNTNSGPGVGIVGQTMKFHGTADLYYLNNGTNILATIYSNDSTATSFPAVTSRDVGPSGGQAVAFTYDLAKSVVYTRQGNPAWAGQKRDGVKPPTRSDNLFFANASFDPQPEWLDMDKVAIPQADEQQRLLTNVMVLGNYNRKPLPRFWFLPKGKKATIVLTGDDHGFGSTAPRLKHYMALSPSNTSEAVANWDAIRSTSYMFSSTPITNAEIAFYQNQGFEIGLHLDPDCGNWTPSTLKSFFDNQVANFYEKFPVVNSFITHRIHCLSWTDWASLPKEELTKGIRLDVSYYFWPDVWIKDRPGMFTGSGMPMRFADTNGTVINVYQVPTQMTDESGQSYPFTINSLLEKANGKEGYYGVFCANMHNDWLTSKGADAIIAAAKASKIPVVSSKQMLEWLDARNNSTFSDFSWNNNRLGFTIAADTNARNLKAMLPRTTASGIFNSLSRGGTAVKTTTEMIKGIEYVFFDAINGRYKASYGGATGSSNKGESDVKSLAETKDNHRKNYR